jgi:hypothetical protein
MGIRPNGLGLRLTERVAALDGDKWPLLFPAAAAAASSSISFLSIRANRAVVDVAEEESVPTPPSGLAVNSPPRRRGGWLSGDDDDDADDEAGTAPFSLTVDIDARVGDMGWAVPSSPRSPNVAEGGV